MGEYCGVHLNRLRKSVGTKPCKKCGKGVSNRYSLCSIVDAAGRDCGYANEKSKDWHRKDRILKKEFKRLAATPNFMLEKCLPLGISTGGEL